MRANVSWLGAVRTWEILKAAALDGLPAVAGPCCTSLIVTAPSAFLQLYWGGASNLAGGSSPTQQLS